MQDDLEVTAVMRLAMGRTNHSHRDGARPVSFRRELPDADHQSAPQSSV